MVNSKHLFFLMGISFFMVSFNCDVNAASESATSQKQDPDFFQGAVSQNEVRSREHVPNNQKTSNKE